MRSAQHLGAEDIDAASVLRNAVAKSAALGYGWVDDVYAFQPPDQAVGRIAADHQPVGTIVFHSPLRQRLRYQPRQVVKVVETARLLHRNRLHLRGGAPGYHCGKP